MSELERANALYDLGRLDEAEERARVVLASAPDDAEALDLLSLILLHNGRWAELDDVAGALLRSAPESARGPMFRAIALGNLDQVERAVELGRIAVGRAPDDPIVVGQFAEILVAVDRPDEAETTIRHALELAPGQASLHRMHAFVLTAADRLDEARAAAQEAVALDPMEPDSHLRLADVLTRQGNLAEAEQEFLAALRQDPSQANLETVLQSLGNAGVPSALGPLLAKIAAAMGLSMPDDLASIRVDVACAMRDAGRYEDAFALASSVLADGFHDLRAYSAALVSAWNIDEYAAGLDLARDASARFPQTPLPLWFQSVFLLALERPAEAVDVAREYVRQAPDAADGYTALGRALLDCGRVDEAVEALTEGLRLAPEDVQLQEYLAEAKG